MSRNPYAQPPITPDALELREPSRVSGLAVSSLVFGLLCCLPVTGFIATILGGASLVRISRSEGRLSGRGLAITGLVLGLIGTLFYIAAAVGVSMAVNQVGTYGPAIKAFQTGDRVAARGALNNAAAAKVTDEQMEAFRAAITSELGNYQRIPKGLGGWFRDYMAVGQQIQNAMPAGRSNQGIIPVPIHFEKGLAVAMVYFDEGSPTPGMPLAKNIQIITQSGKSIWLVPPDGSTGKSSVPPASSPATPQPPPEAPKPDKP